VRAARVAGRRNVQGANPGGGHETGCAGRTRLIVYQPGLSSLSYRLFPDRVYLIGRGLDADLTIDDASVSRVHARLACPDGGWSIEDLGSTNGTIVSGRRVAGIDELHSGDWISFGKVNARLTALRAVEADATAVDGLERWTDALSRRREAATGGEVGGLLQLALDDVLELTGMERGFALMANRDGEIEVRAVAGVSADELAGPGFRGSVGVLQRVLQDGEAVYSEDLLAQRASLAARNSVAAGGLRAVLCLPLVVQERVLGAVYADARDTGNVCTGVDFAILQLLIRHVAALVAAADLGELLEAVAPPAGRTQSRTAARGIADCVGLPERHTGHEEDKR